MKALEERIMQLPTDGYTLQSNTPEAIRTEAFAYEHNHRTIGYSKAQVFLLNLMYTHCMVALCDIRGQEAFV